MLCYFYPGIISIPVRALPSIHILCLNVIDLWSEVFRFSNGGMTFNNPTILSELAAVPNDLVPQLILKPLFCSILNYE
jgi:hypothetical protein